VVGRIAAKFNASPPEAEIIIPQRHYTARGASAQLFNERGPVIVAGPSETGKTLGALHYVDSLCWTYPGVQAAIVRQTYKSMLGTVLQTFEKKVLTQGDGVEKHGGSKAEWYDYPNGSRIWVGGLDNPDKVLSSERDIIYVNQAEEISLESWETLTTRTTGRAANMPWGQTIGDCNPSTPFHWIRVKESEGSLTLLESRHEDNPTLWNAERQEWTEQGRRTLAVLDLLTGVRRDRLRHGKWRAAEGVVYEVFERHIHLKSAPEGSRLYEHIELVRTGSIYSVAGVDWGFTNPGVISVWSVDENKKMKRIAQVYRTHKSIDWWVATALTLKKDFNIRKFACDPARPDNISAFTKAGLPAIGAFNDISLGVQNMTRRLSTFDEEGEPQMMYIADTLLERDEELAAAKKPTCSEEEIEAYVWPLSSNGKPHKEVPVDENNHGMDADRYAAAFVDGLRKKGTGGGIWVAA
jgi:phage terminase large subunit